jgi:hypothetical protein
MAHYKKPPDKNSDTAPNPSRVCFFVSSLAEDIGLPLDASLQASSNVEAT